MPFVQKDEVIDLVSDNESDTIQVSRSTSLHQKRKIDDLSHDENDHDTVVVRPPRKKQSTQSTLDAFGSQRTLVSRTSLFGPEHATVSAGPLTSARQALRELSPKEFSSRMRGPVAFCQRPIYAESFKSRYTTIPRPAVSSVAPEATAIAPSLQARSTSATGRPKRQSTLVMYNFGRTADSESDDELATTSRTPIKRASRSKRHSQNAESDGDFDMSDEHVSADEIASNPDASEDGSSIQSGNDSEESARPVKKSTMTAKTKGTGTKSKSTSRAKVTDIKNLARLQTRARGQAKGIDTSLPPISDTGDIFRDMTKRALKEGLDKAVKHLQGRPLRVATMCSGTESPLLALQMIDEALSELTSSKIEVQHLFSAEIVAYKQAYIERNFHPPIIFRDITELTSAVEDEVPMATTAYGAKVVIPQDVDIVIAGTSCVDFSKLNAHRKNIEDTGESGDTWRAVLAFCRAFRPSIVLLENVRDGPWHSMLADYEAIGYESCGALVDTKDFYIPQTRQRGYMACFDKERLAAAGVKNAGQSWQELMNDLKRPASAPASSFLLPNDQIARHHLRADEPTREIDWSQCQMRHIAYRESNSLGTQRPVTNWSESGSMRVPDNGHPAWYQKQVERVLDVIDAATLRKALPSNGMYDVSYKTRLWDVSQNIDRDEDGRPFGIVGCITPSGQFFASDAGRELTATELLRLQGIPLNKISFTTETPREIQDLAGNAMSSPVIGSSILAALIAGCKMFTTSGKSPNAAASQKSMVSTALIRGQRERVFSSTMFRGLDAADLQEHAKMSTRMCYCEGAGGIATKPIQECACCGHTTCTACGGNPEHEYTPSSVLSSERLSPVAFESELRSNLPLHLVWDPKSLPYDMLRKACKSYQQAVRSAMTATYSFHGIRRTAHWTVTYQSDTSPRSDLVLVLDRAGRIQWKLYAGTADDVPGNHPQRELLRQPIARAEADSSLVQARWQMRAPNATARPVKISCSGARIASWWCRHGMPDFSEHYIWEFLNIKFENHDALAPILAGRYQYLPKCGTASSGLFRKMDSRDGNPVFMFLDPTRTGPPGEDSFVFSHDIARKEYDEAREVIAHLEPSWRPWTTSGKTPMCKPQMSTMLIADDWHPLPASQALSTLQDLLEVRKPGNVADLIQNLTCSETAVVLSCELPAGELQSSRTTGHESVIPNQWVLECLRRHLPFDSWMQLNSDTLNHQCEICVPQRPSLRWTLNEKGDIVPEDDPASAALYERAIKSRPRAFYMSAKREVHEDRVALDVVINTTSLAERAAGRLPKHLTTTLSWRLIGDIAQRAFVFKPFKLQATTGVDPFEGHLGMSVELFPKQKLALTWMRGQETGVSFTLEQTEEENLASAAWSTQVKAEANVVVYGGICADHPGFGKTVTALALIHSEFQAHSVDGIIAAISKPSAAEGLIPIAATLIVCPHTLLKQWVEEAIDKLPSNYKGAILGIKTVADLSKLTFANLKSAKIIFVSRSVLAGEAYTERLAAFAAIPGPATRSGRSFAQWLSFAQRQIPQHLTMLQEQSAGLFKKHIESTYRANLSSEKFAKIIPSRRLRGADYVASKQKQPAAANLKAAASAVDTTHIRTPLLEQFYFNRLIVDEFHQYEPKEFAAIKNLKADKRWGLSGTPAIGDFYDVAQIGSLLGVPLRVGSDAKGVMKAKNAREMKKDMSSFELFDHMRQVPSSTTYSSIHDHHQRFLDTFVRQNVMDFDDLVYREHLVPVSLGLDHHVLYLELSQQLNSMDMRIRKSSKAKANREQRANAVVNASETAEEALSRLAANFDDSYRNVIAERDAEVEDILSVLPGAIADARENEASSFEQFKVSQVDKGALGDALAISKILDIIDGSSQLANGFKKAKKSKKGESSGARACTSRLNDICKRLVVAERSARYLRNVHGLYEACQTGDEVSACDVPGCCEPACTSPDVAVSALCGHFVCRACYDKMKHESKGTCLVKGCRSAMNDYQLLWSNKLTGLRKTGATSHGAKLDAAVQLLRKIEKKGDQAILFVQYESQLHDVGLALGNNGIKATIVEDTATAGAQISDFRENSGTPRQKTVIVLNASSETAAGSNLQCANHVIFLSPLLKDTQYGYDSTMAQAIGRVRRHGQKKEIHVYRIVALDTIDVDILEHREKRVEALTEEGDLIDAPQETSNAPKPERTQLVRENGQFSLRPKSWLVQHDSDEGGNAEVAKVMGKNRVLGWEDFSSLVKFSGAFTENDE